MITYNYRDLISTYKKMESAFKEGERMVNCSSKLHQEEPTQKNTGSQKSDKSRAALKTQ